jgi:pyruvate dehydrogenase E1 component beta subunit
VKQISVREALRQALDEELARDEKVFIIGEEVAKYQGAYKVTGDLYLKYNTETKDRVIDTPITEHGFTGLAIGAGFAGLRPIVEFMTWNFGMQAIDQIINSAAKTRYMSGGQVICPIVFRGPNGAASRVGAQHSQCFASWYGHIPGLKVIAPYFAEDCRGLLKAAIRDDNPIVFLENELTYGLTHEVSDEYEDENFTIEIGKARIVKEGTDITIIAYSRMVKLALEAHEELAKNGINAEILDLRTIRPLDLEAIVNSVKKTNRVLIVEEGWSYAGVASEIAALLNEHAFDYLDCPILRINAVDVPLPYAANLEKLALPKTQEIVNLATKMVKNQI